MKSIYQAIVAEFIGTYILIFTGTGAVMVNQISQGAITHVGISLVFGAVVTVLIYTFGHISNAHFNPAVTLAMWSGKTFPKKLILPYIIAQFCGAIAASITLLITLGNIKNLGATIPLNNNWLQSFIIEIILTFILMTVILGAAVDPRANKNFAPIAIGLTVCLEAMFMGPITGASMNPVRSLGPAIVAGIYQHQWIYICAPIIGAQIAVFLYQYLNDDGLTNSQKITLKERMTQ